MGKNDDKGRIEQGTTEAQRRRLIADAERAVQEQKRTQRKSH